jgi:hypothetical protein
MYDWCHLRTDPKAVSRADGLRNDFGETEGEAVSRRRGEKRVWGTYSTMSTVLTTTP